MIERPRNLSTIKYSVLKPNHQINSMKRNFTLPHASCPYELAVKDNITIRRYKQSVDSLEQMLQDYQWRQEEKSPIVHCLYIELLAPNSTSKVISVDVYVENLEVTLSKMKKLLLAQATYLIIRATEGYSALWERFKHISIDEEMIGLDCGGNCLVWMNRSLEKNQSEDLKMETPHQIVKKIILLVKSKSQPVCHTFLSKLLDNLSKKDFDFKESLRILTIFVKNYRINIPQHLKYLVHQNRLDKNLKSFKTQRNIYESKQKIKTLKIPCFVASKLNLIQDLMESPIEQKTMAYKSHHLPILRKTTLPSLNCLTYRSIARNRSIASTNDQINDFKFNEYTSQKLRYNFSYSSRPKSQSNGCLNVVNNIRPKKEIETARAIYNNYHENKRSSDYSDNVKTAVSFASIETNKKNNAKLINSIDPNQILEVLNPFQQYESYQCSPFIIRKEQEIKKKTAFQQLSLQKQNCKFNAIVLFDQVLRANKWTKTFKNLLETEANLNTSITQGQDTNNYLSEVRLQKLDNINKHMFVSLNIDSSKKLLDLKKINQ